MLGMVRVSTIPSLLLENYFLFRIPLQLGNFSFPLFFSEVPFSFFPALNGRNIGFIMVLFLPGVDITLPLISSIRYILCILDFPFLFYLIS